MSIFICSHWSRQIQLPNVFLTLLHFCFWREQRRDFTSQTFQTYCSYHNPDTHTASSFGENQSSTDLLCQIMVFEDMITQSLFRRAVLPPVNCQSISTRGFCMQAHNIVCKHQLCLLFRVMQIDSHARRHRKTTRYIELHKKYK